jgi:hypothetical protein
MHSESDQAFRPTQNPSVWPPKSEGGLNVHCDILAPKSTHKKLLFCTPPGGGGAVRNTDLVTKLMITKFILLNL